MLKGLHHIGVMVTDIDRSMEFYKMIGFALRRAYQLDNGVRVAFMVAGSAVVELVMPVDVASVRQRDNGRVDHIALEVENIDGVIDELKAKGIQFDAPSAGKLSLFDNGSKNIFFAGPDGERLELFEEL